MKKVIGLALGLVLVLLLSVSCGGVAQDKYDKVNADLIAAQAQVQQLQDKITKAKIEIDIINSVFIPALMGDITLDEMVSLIQEWQVKIDTTGDAALQAKFQAITESGDTDRATEEFFLYLFDDIAATLK